MIEVGDTIKFKTVHYRVGVRTAIRKVVSLWPDSDFIGVRMFGWNPFWLKSKEVIEIIKKA